MEQSAVSTTRDPKRELLRHTLATVAYRGGKTLRGAPASFATLRIGNHTRTPGEVLAHICDLLDWALWLGKGKHVWRDSTPQDWDVDVTRLFDALRELDAFLASDAPLESSPEKLFQGPVADALTHIGQLAMLRRMAGAPVRGENYHKAQIAVGRVGAEQSSARVEFD